MRKTAGILRGVVWAAGWTLLASLWSVSCAGPAALSARDGVLGEILKRADRRDPGRDGFFERQLLSPDAEVRWESAVALGRIGDARTLPWLFPALRNGDAALRAAAAFAIGEIEDRESRRLEGRTADGSAPAEVRRLLQDPSLRVRMRAMEALGKMGASSEAIEIAKAVGSFRHDGSPLHRDFLDLGITALMRLQVPATYPVLHRLAAAEDPEVQWRAANALFRLRDTTACPVFVRLVASRDAGVQAHAARGLGICAAEPRAAALLAPLLAAGHPPNVRVCAVQALAMLRRPASVPAVARALDASRPDRARPEDVHFAVQAAAALGEMESAAAVPPLARLLRFPGPAAEAAAVALAKSLRNDPERFFAMVGRSRFTSPQAARSWARALGELGGPRAARELMEMLQSHAEAGDDTAGALAVPVILESLGKVNAPGLNDLLRMFFGSRDGVVLRAAAAAYRPDPSTPRPWIPVAGAYRAMAAAKDSETLVALLNRLEPWMREPEVQAVLREALAGRSRNARIAAARLLRQAGPADIPQDPGATATITSDLTYRLVASLRRGRAIAVLETERGSVEIELFRADAPMTVANFTGLARSGFYDGLTFMRAVPFFVVQGGDPRNDQEGGPGYDIRCEINLRPFRRGSVGMALAGKDTGGSQFFITLAAQPHLDGGYTCFGQVISGFQVVERITAGDVIRRIRIEEDVTFLKPIQ